MSTELEAIRAKYDSDQSQEHLHCLVMSQKGIGKTSLLETCRKPIVIDSFDPGGTKVLKVDGKMPEGFYPDTRFEIDDSKFPTAFVLWEVEFMKRVNSGFFNNIGTYSLDSLTWFLDALYSKIGKTRFANDGILEIKGWALLVNVIRDYMKIINHLPCDVIVTGHVVKEKDDLAGLFVVTIALPPSCQIKIPTLFDEYYYLSVEGEGKRVLYTTPTDKHQAATRIGKGKLLPKEEPNIKNILKKCGLPSEDLK
jgi:hypothetical protein